MIELRIRHNCVEVKNYKCPDCGEYPNDNNEGYVINGVKYPKISNENKGSNLDGSYHNWDEEHRCENCGKKYWFENGAY